MKTIVDLMRVDLIALSGKKGGTFAAMVILLVVCALIGIFLVPGFLSVYVFAAAVLIVPMIIDRELRSEYERTFCVLPADRKSIVLARFLLTTALLSGIGIAVYAFIQISSALGINEQTENEIIEIFDMFGISMSITEFNNEFFSIAFMAGIAVMSKKLRKYYKNGAVSKKNTLLRNVLKTILIYIVIVAVVLILIYASSVPFVQTAFSLIFGIASALSQPADGALLCLTLIAVGYGAAVYQTVCAVLEYEEREL